MDFILEQERSHGILRGLHIICKSVYCPQNYGPKDHGHVYRQKKKVMHTRIKNTGRENTTGSCSRIPTGKPFQSFISKKVCHAEIAKEVKQKNDDIYRKVMVGLV